MDIVPWSIGLGFQNADDWWHYVRTRTERDKLNLLLMVASLSEEVAQLLLSHDLELFDRFSLTEQTRHFLSEIEAKTLDEFAQQYLVKSLVDRE